MRKGNLRQICFNMNELYQCKRMKKDDVTTSDGDPFISHDYEPEEDEDNVNYSDNLIDNFGSEVHLDDVDLLGEEEYSSEDGEKDSKPGFAYVNEEYFRMQNSCILDVQIIRARNAVSYLIDPNQRRFLPIQLFVVVWLPNGIVKKTSKRAGKVPTWYQCFNFPVNGPDIGDDDEDELVCFQVVMKGVAREPGTSNGDMVIGRTRTKIPTMPEKSVLLPLLLEAPPTFGGGLTGGELHVSMCMRRK